LAGSLKGKVKKDVINQAIKVGVSPGDVTEK
jgi:hypothetical protein